MQRGHIRQVTSTKRLKHITRWGLCGIATAAVMGFAVWAWQFKASNYDIVALIGERPFNEQTKVAVDVRLTEAANMFQLGLLVLASLWGLVIAKKDEARLTFEDWPELLMFVEASAAIVGSFTLYKVYVDDISDLYALAGKTCSSNGDQCIPDVLSPKVQGFLDFQLWFLVVGALIAVLTIFSAHQLKRRGEMELVVTLLAISVMIGMGQSTEKWTPKAKSCTAASTKDVSPVP